MKKNYVWFLLFLFFSVFQNGYTQKSIEKKPDHPILVDTIALKTKGIPINPFRDTLFYVYNRVGSFWLKTELNQ